MKKSELKLARAEDLRGRTLLDSEISRIAKLYEKKIRVPRSKPVKQIILCPVGLVGAGKTTVLKPIAMRLNLVRISTDEIRHELLLNKYNLEKTRNIAGLLFQKYLTLGYSLAVDADCVDPRNQKDLRSLSRQYKALLVWIHIKPPERFIIDKLKNHKPTWLFKNPEEAIANYKRRKPMHREYASKIKFDFTFDTSRSDLNEKIKMFIAKMKVYFEKS